MFTTLLFTLKTVTFLFIFAKDFLETIYNEKDNDFQNQSRPKRASRRKINYKEEDKDIEIPPALAARDSEDEFNGHEGLKSQS